MAHSASTIVPITRFTDGNLEDTNDSVVSEEPLEIRLNDEPLAVTMRTPGMDEALAIGFLVTEGILRYPDDLFDVTRCSNPDEPNRNNIVTVYVNPDAASLRRIDGRQRYANAACGICGRASIDQVRTHAEPFASRPTISIRTLLELPGRMRDSQQVFSRTGGIHAAAVFTTAGEWVAIAEDVGRHNTVDKVAGLLFQADRLGEQGLILVVSGRAGFEIVQKAAVARISLVASVSAPSSLAVELAHELGMGLAGFVRGANLNIYSGADAFSLE